jgi:hypothetical protein
MLYDQADFASFQSTLATTTSPTQLQTFSSNSKTSSIPGPTETSLGNSSPTGSTGLSPGAKAGIAVAAVLAVIGLLFLFLFIRRHRKQQQATHHTQHPETSTAEADGKPVFISEFPTSANKHELPSPFHQNQELDASDNRPKYSMGHELHAPVPSELEDYDYDPPAGPIVQATTSGPVKRKAVPTTTGNDDDPELQRMRAEIEVLRVEKETRLQDIERRERELSRAIVAKSGGEMRGNLG